MPPDPEAIAAQQFLAALARDWDSRLDALADHLSGVSAEPTG